MKRCLERLRAVVGRCGLQQLGAVSIEYVGLAMVAAAIVGGIYLSLNGGMTRSVNQALGQAAISFDGPGGSGVGIGAGGGGGGQALGISDERRGGELSEIGYMEPVEAARESSRQSFLGGIWDFFRRLLGGERESDGAISGDDTSGGAQNQRATFGDLLDASAEQPRATFGEIMHDAKYGTAENPVSRVSMDALSDDSYYVKSGLLTLTGSGTPGETLTVFVDGKRVSSVAVDSVGQWTWITSTASGHLRAGVNQVAVGSSLQNLTASRTVHYVQAGLNVPDHRQGSLADGYACGPTCLHMAFDYYHEQNSSYETVGDTQRIVDDMHSKDRFTYVSESTATDKPGADAGDMAETAKDYGYSGSNLFIDWSQDDLKRAITVGHPVIAIVRVGFGTSETVNPHAVLVTGVSDDGTTVIINDPQSGPREYAWKTFYDSWSSFGEEATRHGVEVMP